MDYSALQTYFTDAEIRIYFGARSQSEINEAAAFMANMTRDERTRFKSMLATLNTTRLTEKTYGKR